jgi:glycerol-3-phosphate acyltransferase PlsX
LNGVVVKSHGGTDALGFATAIDVAIDMARNELVAKIAHDIAEKNRLIGEPSAAIVKLAPVRKEA